jgi:hypothetical protein
MSVLDTSRMFAPTVSHEREVPFIEHMENQHADVHAVAPLDRASNSCG